MLQGEESKAAGARGNRSAMYPFTWSNDRMEDDLSRTGGRDGLKVYPKYFRVIPRNSWHIADDDPCIQGWCTSSLLADVSKR